MHGQQNVKKKSSILFTLHHVTKKGTAQASPAANFSEYTSF